MRGHVGVASLLGGRFWRLGVEAAGEDLVYVLIAPQNRRSASVMCSLVSPRPPPQHPSQRAYSSENPWARHICPVKQAFEIRKALIHTVSIEHSDNMNSPSTYEPKRESMKYRAQQTYPNSVLMDEGINRG